MTALTENDLNRLEDLIVNGQKTIENRLTTIENRLTTIDNRLTDLENGQKALEIGQADIRGDLKVLDARINSIETATGRMPELSEKIGELKNWKQIGLIPITAVLSSLLSATPGGVIGWLLRSNRFSP